MPTTDRRPALYASFDHAANIVEGVKAEQLSEATSCPDFDVSALVDHLVGAANRAVAVGRGEAQSGEEFPHVDLLEAPDLLRQAGKEAQSVWSDDARLVATVKMPWGETYDGATLVDMYLTELATHAWDLAAATGQRDHLDPRLAETALEGARAMLKPEYRDLAGPGSPFGAEVPVAGGSPAWDRLAGFLGRDPS